MIHIKFIKDVTSSCPKNVFKSDFTHISSLAIQIFFALFLEIENKPRKTTETICNSEGQLRKQCWKKTGHKQQKLVIIKKYIWKAKPNELSWTIKSKMSSPYVRAFYESFITSPVYKTAQKSTIHCCNRCNVENLNNVDESFWYLGMEYV